jgi:hypothetical protein
MDREEIARQINNGVDRSEELGYLYCAASTIH